jgi:hypothetical protein
LIANEIDEKQLEEIFTAEKLGPLIIAILNPRNKRTIDVAEMLANRVFQKLSNELPTTMVDSLSSDIGKTWTYAKMASEFWGKPIIGKIS